MLFPMEQKLMSLLWDHSPITAAYLARLAADEIGWKRTTTYTVIARLVERGVMERDGKLVRPLLSREQAEEDAVRLLLAETFEGDRSRLLAAIERALPEGEKTESSMKSIDISRTV